jgi:hypothetical protein
MGPWLKVSVWFSMLVALNERERLAADRNRRRRHIKRVCIVLVSADRHPPHQVAHNIGIRRSTMWHWQQRFAQARIVGMMHRPQRE